MTSIGLSYIDDALGVLAGETQQDHVTVPIWRHFHWGLYEGPDVTDDSPERYYAAAETMTRHILAAAGVTAGARVLDVGCGFGGTLDLIRTDHGGCELVGVNIDERQLQAARQLLAMDAGREVPISFVTGDGCRLPVGDRAVDHVLAVECLFHFPSRKRFFKEAARVLRPGGTVALSDFLARPGAAGSLLQAKLAVEAQPAPGSGEVSGTAAAPSAAPEASGSPGPSGSSPPASPEDVIAQKLGAIGAHADGWYGSFSRPLTPDGYARLGRAAGFDLLVDEDVTARTLPTYAALHRFHRESTAIGGKDGPLGELSAAANRGIEGLVRRGDLQYHVLAFRRRDA